MIKENLNSNRNEVKLLQSVDPLHNVGVGPQ